ncbi:peroxisome membrane protein [Exidia glandulosa HHB12029]|uniref:Peroxisomal membrane protein PEX16 n=1 Tax=Exidia glandulosa HHB12029 TaxID=1314781 RepID=A0A165PRQ8_EXIGL|nr:peroxisome membrane protein [Exidia glandulosa HHB12029]
MASPLARYESFLISNASTISTIESSLRSLTWFLPGRFKDAELASETLTATMNLLNLYHDTLLARRLAQLGPKHKPVLPPSLHTRYTRAWADKDKTYRWAARMLEIVRFTELVVEMGLRRKVGPTGRWRGIVTLEVIKAILRLILLKVTRRPLLLPPIPERELDPSALPPSPAEEALQPHASSDETPAHLLNNHVAFDEPNPMLTAAHSKKSAAVDDYLLPRALSPASVKPPVHLMRQLSSPKEWLAEYVHILRPLVYAVLLAQSDKTSSRPLVTSIVMDLTAAYLRRTPPPSNALERQEYARRDRDMLWYLFRGAIWQSFTRPQLDSLADKTSNAPVLSLFSALLKEWIPLIDEYHYYTAT